MESRLWYFSADMNADGAVTIADVWLWLQWLFFYPGDFIVNLAIHFGFFEVVDKLELTTHIYGGLLSGVLSALFWFFILRLFD